MDIFESLENLDISEECFNDIVTMVEAMLNEGLPLYAAVLRKQGNDEPTKLAKKAWKVPSSYGDKEYTAKNQPSEHDTLNPDNTYDRYVLDGNSDYDEGAIIRDKQKESGQAKKDHIARKKAFELRKKGEDAKYFKLLKKLPKGMREKKWQDEMKYTDKVRKTPEFSKKYPEYQQ